jgi:hypothetical protein
VQCRALQCSAVQCSVPRNAVVLKRAPSVTSAEMRAEVMKSEVEQVRGTNA